MSPFTVEGSLELDVNVLKREGWFEESGRVGTLRWFRDGDESQVAACRCIYSNTGEDEAVVIRYSLSENGSDSASREVEISIFIDRTECNFGGNRPWFVCPECETRQAKLYRPLTENDGFLCRDCHGLLYRSQTYRTPVGEALDQLDAAVETIQEGGVSREVLRDFYEARQTVIEAYNDRLDGYEEKFGTSPESPRPTPLPPFEVWVEDLLSPATGRDYGVHGQCDATAQTTGERCRQPATGTHGKCYYHGGASGSGAPEGNKNAATD